MRTAALLLAAALLTTAPAVAPVPSVLVAFPDGTAVVLDAATGESRFSVKTAAKEWSVPRKEEEGGREVLCRSLPVALLGEEVLAVEGREIVSYDRDGKRSGRESSKHIQGAVFLHEDGARKVVLTASPEGTLVQWNSERWDADFLRQAGPSIVARLPEGLEGGAGASAYSAAAGLWILADGAAGFASLGAKYLEVKDVATRRLGSPPILAMAVSPDGNRLAVSHGTTLRVKTFTLLADGKIRGLEGAFKANGPARTLAWNADASLLAIGSDTGETRVVRGRREEDSTSLLLPQVTQVTPGKSPVRLLRFLKDEALLLAVDDEGVARTVRWKTGEVVSTRRLLPERKAEPAPPPK